MLERISEASIQRKGDVFQMSAVLWTKLTGSQNKKGSARIWIGDQGLMSAAAD